MALDKYMYVPAVLDYILYEWMRRPSFNLSSDFVCMPIV